MAEGSQAKRDAPLGLATVGTPSEDQYREGARLLGALLARAALRAVDQGKLVLVDTAAGRVIMSPAEATRYIRSQKGERIANDG